LVVVGLEAQVTLSVVRQVGWATSPLLLVVGVVQLTQ
jgi:hypothetical protein